MLADDLLIALGPVAVVLGPVAVALAPAMLMTSLGSSLATGLLTQGSATPETEIASGHFGIGGESSAAIGHNSSEGAWAERASAGARLVTLADLRLVPHFL